MDRRPDMVKIFDPESPSAPRAIVPGNFNPGFGHRRWEHRPTAQSTEWLPIVLEVMGIPPALDIAADVPAEDAAALREAHAGQLALADQVVASIIRYNIETLEDMAAAGMIAGVNSDISGKLIAYARAHPFMPDHVLNPQPVAQPVIETGTDGGAEGASGDEGAPSEGEVGPEDGEAQEGAGGRRRRGRG